MAFALVGAVLATPESARGFAQLEEGDSLLELRGNFRWNLIGTQPLDDALPEGEVTHTSFIRLIGDAFIGSSFFASVHALEVVSTIPARPLNAAAFNVVRTGERNRSAALRWNQATEDVSAFLELDRAMARLSLPPVDLTVGRQPINLATASLFTPNDFFAPFAAQAFFRVYKPGVDAARLDVELAPLTYISVVGVLGYDHGSEPRAGDPVRIAESSLLGRGVTSWGDFELSVLGGAVADRAVAGGGVQGELFDGLGVRAEGHARLGDDESDGPEVLTSVGVEHRFQSSLFLQLEYFHNGIGASDPEDYVATLLRGLGDLPYLGRHLLGASASYEITPLCNGTVLGLANLVDGSTLWTAYVEYSLLDEATLALSASVPVGAGPRGDLGGFAVEIPTEFGLVPVSASVELRAYF